MVWTVHKKQNSVISVMEISQL